MLSTCLNYQLPKSAKNQFLGTEKQINFVYIKINFISSHIKLIITLFNLYSKNVIYLKKYFMLILQFYIN